LINIVMTEKTTMINKARDLEKLLLN